MTDEPLCWVLPYEKIVHLLAFLARAQENPVASRIFLLEEAWRDVQTRVFLAKQDPLEAGRDLCNDVRPARRICDDPEAPRRVVKEGRVFLNKGDIERQDQA